MGEFGSVPPESLWESRRVEMESAASSFALRWINDASVRVRYATWARRVSFEMEIAVTTGRLTPSRAAEHAHHIRNRLVEVARTSTSEIGVVFAREMKGTVPPLAQLEAKYALELFGRPFAELDGHSQQGVHRHIVRMAGRTNGAINRLMPWLSRAGIILLVASSAITIHRVLTSKDQLRAGARELTALGAGALGSVAAGTLVAPIVAGSAAAAVVVVPLAVFLGSVVGAEWGGVAFDNTIPPGRSALVVP